MSAEHGAAAERRLLHVFRERAISVRTLDRPLRLLLALALLQLGLAAVLIALRGSPMPTVSVFTHENEPTAMPAPVFWASVGFVVLAWTYLLAGALSAHWPLRLAALALFTAALYPAYEGLGDDRRWLVAIGASLAGIWGIGLGRLALERRLPRHRPQAGLDRGRVATFVALLGLVAGLYGAIWASGRTGGTHGFTIAFSLQLAAISLFLIPVLTLAGVDFAEWGDLASARVADLTGRVRPPHALAGLTAAASVAILVLALRDLGGDAWRELALAAGAAAAILLVARGARVSSAWPAHVPPAAIAVVAVSFFGLFYALGARASAEPKPAEHAGPVYRHEAEPRFSIPYPPGWHASSTRLGDVALTTFRPPAGGPGLLFFVAGFGAGRTSPEGALADWLAQTLPAYPAEVEAPHHVGAWLEQRFALGDGLGGVGFARVEHGRLWLVYGIAQRPLLRSAVPLFTELAEQWSPEAAPAREAAAEPTTHEGGGGVGADRLLGWGGLVWAIVIALAAVALVAARRRQAGALHAAGLFLVVVGLLFVLGALREIGALFHLAPHALPTLHLPGVQAFVAIVTLAWVAQLVLRRRLTEDATERLALLLALGGGLQALALMFDLFTRGLEARLSVAQACVILLALLWDVVVSGELFTNGHDARFPRHARILLFLGYVMLVSTAVLFFSSLHVEATHAHVEPQFESELWPQLGLVLLGMPLLCCLFALRVSRRTVAR